MILERLYLENYKQFREPIELLPPEGAIGVAGRNGAGKSTLFESILWAFFGSRGGGPRFANDVDPLERGLLQRPFRSRGDAGDSRTLLYCPSPAQRQHDDGRGAGR